MPFHLAVAEVLLQKTRANQVVEVWYQIVSRFPKPESLREAPVGQIQGIVGPLGLGRQRTGRLKALAASWETLWESKSSLPGLGPYGTAIVRMAAGLESSTVPIDGNIARVISRYYGLKFERGEARKKSAVRNAVRGMLDASSGSETKLKLLYGLVDLGAVVCKPSKPSCTECPLVLSCSLPLSRDLPESRNSFTDMARARATGGVRRLR